MGWLLSSIAFRDDISASDANYLLDTGERLTYRQLVCVAVLGDDLERMPDWEGDVLKAEAEPRFSMRSRT